MFYAVSFISTTNLKQYLNYQDVRISQTPYHSLTNQERVIFSQRKELLTYMAKRFREEVSKYEEILYLPTPISGNRFFCPHRIIVYSLELRTQTSTPTTLLSRNASLQKEKSLDQVKLSGEFRYCATCGRSSGVRLTICRRCQKVSFCSKTCKIEGWYQFHRYECRQVSSQGKQIIFISKKKKKKFSYSVLVATMQTSSSQLNKVSI
jgi:hypothetical protein